MHTAILTCGSGWQSSDGPSSVKNALTEPASIRSAAESGQYGFYFYLALVPNHRARAHFS